jgi:uncharacterized membrane protein
MKVRDILVLRITQVTFSILAVGIMLNFFASQAQADLRICNKTSELIGVAIGYRDSTDWQSEGWWRIPPDQCESVIESSLSARFYYLYAEHASQEDTWGGNIYMCSSSKDFQITGVKDCYARGYEKLGFFEVDTGDQSNWTVQFKDKAKLASNSSSDDGTIKSDK